MTVKERIEKMTKIERKEKNVYLEGTEVFCTSLELATITGKQHKNVLRDIEEVFVKLLQREKWGKISNFSTNAEMKTLSAKLDLTGSNLDAPRESIYDVLRVFTPKVHCTELSKLSPYFRIALTEYKDAKGEIRPMYVMDEVFYLCMMNKYNDVIRYLMAKFYVERNDSLASDKTYIDGMRENELFAAREILMNDKEPCSQTDKTVEAIFKEGNYASPEARQCLWSLCRMEEMERLLNSMRNYGKDYEDEFKNFLFPNCYASSVVLARYWRKDHFHVLRDISSIREKLEESGVEVLLLKESFQDSWYKDVQGKEQKMIAMDKIGFLTVAGRYSFEINYRLAEFYVYNTSPTIKYEDLFKLDVKYIEEALKRFK